jgi:NAD(P)H-dependent FMN reductase
MVRILGISGSLRAQSFNTALLRAAQAVAGAHAHIDAAGLRRLRRAQPSRRRQRNPWRRR